MTQSPSCISTKAASKVGVPPIVSDVDDDDPSPHVLFSTHPPTGWSPNRFPKTLTRLPPSLLPISCNLLPPGQLHTADWSPLSSSSSSRFEFVDSPPRGTVWPLLISHVLLPLDFHRHNCLGGFLSLSSNSESMSNNKS